MYLARPILAIGRALAALIGCIAVTLPASVQASGCGLGDTWQEAESGFTAIWRREGDAGRFVADYTAPDGRRATTHNQVSLNDSAVTIRRLGSSDSTMCSYAGTLSGNVIAGSYSCPSAWSGERPWHATVFCPTPPATPAPLGTARGPAAADVPPALINDRSVVFAVSNGSAIALLVLIRAAMGQIPAGQVADAVDQEATAFRSGAVPNLHGDLSEAATNYSSFVRGRIQQVANSLGHADASSMVSAMIRLRIANDLVVAELQKGIVPVQAIMQIDRIRAHLPGAANALNFENHRALTERAAQLLFALPTPRRPTR